LLSDWFGAPSDICEIAMSWCTAQCEMLFFLCKNRHESITKFEEERNKSILVIWQLSGSALSPCFFTLLSGHESSRRFIAMKAYKFTPFEVF